MADAAQGRKLSIAEFIEQRDFALERCALLRAELADRDALLARKDAKIEDLARENAELKNKQAPPAPTA
jgi:hypothetical protein